MTTTIPLEHDRHANDSHPDYWIGRQPFGYQAIVDWCRVNGYPYRVFDRTTDLGMRECGIKVDHPTIGKGVPMRVVRERLNAARLP